MRGRAIQSLDVNTLDGSCLRVTGAGVHQPAGSLGVGRRGNELKLWGRAVWPRADRRGADTACRQGQGEETVEQPHVKEGAFRGRGQGVGD